MTPTALGPGRTTAARPLRHAALTTAALLTVCAVIGILSALTYTTTAGKLHTMTARATGTITGAQANEAIVVWPGHPNLAIPVTGTVPWAGTKTQIAYNPTDPTMATIPDAAILTSADRARDGVLFAALIAVLVILTDAWLLTTRRRSARQPAYTLTVRRITMRRGLMARTWLETDDHRWIPVYFDPAVVSLPAPTTVQARGTRLITVDVTGAHLYPAGRTRHTEPRGRRTDSPTQPDAYTADRATRAARWRHQLRVDAALVIPAPVVGLWWAYLDNSGISGWLGATAITAAAALWWAAIRGADPS